MKRRKIQNNMDVVRIKNALRNKSGQLINSLFPPRTEIHYGYGNFPFNLIFVAPRWEYKSRFVGDGFEYRRFISAFKKLADVVYFIPIERKKEIIRKIRKFKKEDRKNIVFSVFQYFKDIPQDYFKLSEEGFYLVNWYTDDDMFFDRFSRHVAKYFNLNITTFEPNLDRYKALGADAVTSQWAAEDCSSFLDKRRYLACFIGRMYGERVELIRKLKKEFKDLVFVHDTRKKVLKENAMIDAYRNSWLAIDDPLSFDKKHIQIKARVFENPSYGCLVVTKPNPRILKHFKLNQEILFWRDIPELISILKDCKQDQRPYKKMAYAAYNRVKREHLYKHRFKTIFEFINQKVRST